MKLKVVLEPSEEGGLRYMSLICQVVSVKGIVGRRHCRISKEAIELYLEPVEDDMTHIPDAVITEVAL